MQDSIPVFQLKNNDTKGLSAIRIVKSEHGHPRKLFFNHSIVLGYSIVVRLHKLHCQAALRPCQRICVSVTFMSSSTDTGGRDRGLFKRLLYNPAAHY